jgi:hypothetical protein
VPGWTVGRGSAAVAGEPLETVSHDWSDSNLPWAYTSNADWEDRLPEGVPVVNLSGTGATFWDRLNNTVNAQPGRFICRLGDGDHVLTSFRLIGGSGDQSYSFGFWFPKLAGFVGNGPDKTFVSMAANSMTGAQLTRLSGMESADFAPNQMGMFRIDSTASEPTYLGGLTFRAANQNSLTSVAADVPASVPQPAPHQGPVFYTASTGVATMSHVRFQGAGKAMTSSPPFEMANFTSAKYSIDWYKCEFDGRISPAYDAARPRKCAPVMMNGEVVSDFVDCWFHHSNISRYAANDQNVSRAALAARYTATRCKAEQITNTNNDGLGGVTNATPFGWESTNAEIRIIDCIISQDNTSFSGQIPMHLQLTYVGGVNPRGGRLYVYGGDFRNDKGFPALDGFLCIRATTSWWVDDGYNTTMFVYPNADGSGTRLQPWNYTGSWPPSAGTISAAGVSPSTHYLVRG